MFGRVFYSAMASEMCAVCLGCDGVIGLRITFAVIAISSNVLAQKSIVSSSTMEASVDWYSDAISTSESREEWDASEDSEGRR